jgi:predicted dinucleotide-utilizing enzyme
MSNKGIAFVGGGHAAAVLLDLFVGDDQYHVLGVADPNSQAEGILHANKLNIDTSRNLQQLVQDPNVDVLIELTGNDHVRQMLLEQIRPDQNVITAGGARMLVDLVSRQAAFQAVFQQLLERMQGAIGSIDKTADQTKDVLDDFKILALNAKIVAGRMGDSGAAFDAVVNKMQELINNIEGSLKYIMNSSEESHEVLRLLEEAELKLKTG